MWWLRKAGKPGWQPDGSYLTPEGQRLKTELEQTAYLRTVQDWIIRPLVKTVPGVAGVDGSIIGQRLDASTLVTSTPHLSIGVIQRG